VEDFLANTRSAKKRIRQNEKQRAHNKMYRTRARSQVKQARSAIEAGDPAAAKEAVLAAISELDKSAARGVIHSNNASRRKSRLMKLLQRSRSAE
jgi:small subunit ribosomal protein S20